VAPDNPVRAIEAYVCALDLAGFGFRHAEGDGGAGQPPYDPADLLKLHLHGFLNQMRSSRRLEREAGRNVELIWLLRGLVPGYRTIGNFRKALTAANRDFVMLARDLDLPDGDLVAIDGAFFHGNASKASIVTASGWQSNSRRWSAISKPVAPLWRPTTRQRRRRHNQRSRRARAF
jgi:transposase